MNQNADLYQALRGQLRQELYRQNGLVNELSEYLLFGPDLSHLLVRLTLDPEVPVREKAKLGFAIAYYVSPVNLLPTMVLGPVGFIDDLAIAAYVLHSLINQTDPMIVRRHWAGTVDILTLVQNIVAIADRMMGGGFLRKMESVLNLVF